MYIYIYDSQVERDYYYCYYDADDLICVMCTIFSSYLTNESVCSLGISSTSAVNFFRKKSNDKKTQLFNGYINFNFTMEICYSLCQRIPYGSEIFWKYYLMKISSFSQTHFVSFPIYTQLYIIY